ncbi:MAG: hypothetical protein ACREOZ_03515, partial [Gloeomargaritales cyanobacterium]
VLMKAESNGPEALQDFIRYVGCPTLLHNDRSKMQLNKKIKKICRDAYIPQSTTEAYHPWQNPAERRIQEVKKVADYFMDISNAPTKAWGYAILHSVWCLNRTATKNLGYITPYEFARGETPDISVLQFEFWESLFYLDPLSRFPQPTEQGGRFLGIAEYVGDAMTYWILSDTNQVIARSCVRRIDESKRKNTRAIENLPAGILKDNRDRRWTKQEKESVENKVAINENEEDAEYDYGTMKENIENIYEDIINNADQHEELLLELDHIVTHRHGKGGNIELEILWKNGETKWEKLSVFRHDYPMAIADYARKMKLYKMRGFKWVQKFIKENQILAKATIKNCVATVRKSKRVMRELRTSGKKYQYGIEIPRNVAHALQLDDENRNHRWRDAMAKEMKAMECNEVFDILEENKQPPKGYTKIPLIMIFTVKQDGTYKARLVAGGHMTGPPLSDVYASVVKGENVRLL